MNNLACDNWMSLPFECFALFCNLDNLGNSYCNKEMNNDICAFDFGDCLPTKGNQYDLQSILLICYFLVYKKIGCQLDEQSIGDGICDDDNNYLLCSYDGGDCCKPFINETFAKSVFAIKTAFVILDTTNIFNVHTPHFF